MSAIEVSDNLRVAVKHFGAPGEQWLNDLPSVVAGLEAEWGIVRGRTLTGGNFAYVAEAVTADGEPAVLKIALPRSDNAFTQERRALQAADGDPYARLIRFDDERRSLLLERLGRQMADLGWPVDRQISAITATVARGWRHVDGKDLESGASKAAWLAEFIPRSWEKLSHPCLERSVARAVDYAVERSRTLAAISPVLVHGDAHPWNVLEAATSDGRDSRDETGFTLIDPEGLASEPAHDLGVVLRGWNESLLRTDAANAAFERCHGVALNTGVDVESIWRWSYIERLSSGLFLLELGHAGDARAYLEVSDRLAGALPPWR